MFFTFLGAKLKKLDLGLIEYIVIERKSETHESRCLCLMSKD